VETKFAIDQKDEDYSSEKYFRRLIRSIKVSQKYFLFFVACNQIPRQNELIKQIKAKLPEKNIEVIDFNEPITDLLFELEAILADKKPDAIFIKGLGNSISSEGSGKENAVIHSLNLSRDSFIDALPCPMYLWLPEYAIVKITRHAPDFFSVRSSVFYFSSTAEQVISEIFQNTSAEWLETSSLSLTEKQKRIAMLESLLAEYQGLQTEKRDKSAERRLKRQLADIYYSISKYKKSIEYTEQALVISREIENRKGESADLSSLGSAYQSLGDNKKALKYYEQALAISREIGNLEGESADLGNIGSIYRSLGNHQEAIKFHEQALAISRYTNNRQTEEVSLVNLGNTYLKIGDDELAIECYKKALIISNEIGYRSGMESALGNLGSAYSKLGEHKKAIRYHEQALKISQEIGFKKGEGIHLGNLGNTYLSLDNKKKAKDYLTKSVKILREIDSPNAKIFIKNLDKIKKSEIRRAKNEWVKQLRLENFMEGCFPLLILALFVIGLLILAYTSC
jgi:tetratricopeptide (TPR) repeat protein